MSDANVTVRVPVIAAILRIDSSVLVGKRPAHKRHGGLWEFPGGKFEPGENLLDAARRELSEELGIEASGIGTTLHVARDPGTPFDVHFVEVEWEGHPRALEHSEVRWVTVEELARLELAPCDADFVRGHAFEWAGSRTEERVGLSERPRPSAVLREAAPGDQLATYSSKGPAMSEADLRHQNDAEETNPLEDQGQIDEKELERLRFPIGRLAIKTELTRNERASCIDEIAALPSNLRMALQDLGEANLDTRYRPGGWTIRQVVHHLPDSHMNSYIRFKLGVTEKEPTIGVYKEALWAEQPDARTGPVEPSLKLLEALHVRWTLWMQALDEPLWKRVVLHPENGRMTLEQLLQVYCWHSRHHVAHITRLRDRMGWN